MKQGNQSFGVESISRSQTNSLLSVTALWVEAMQGGGDIEAALERIGEIAGANRAALIAHNPEHDETQKIAVFDDAAGRLLTSRQWTVFAPDIIGPAIHAAAGGSVWTKSDSVRSDLIQRRPVAQVGSEPREVVVVVLENSGSGIKILELHYLRHPKPTDYSVVSVISEHIAIAWRNRIPGTSYVPRLRLIGSGAEEIEAAVNGKWILSHENPCNLTRSEFRVCLLLRGGASIKVISELTGSREKTIRAHLSSIYAKIGVTGQLELIHRLVGSREDSGEAPDLAMRTC